MGERSQDKIDRLHQRLVDEVAEIGHPQAKVRKLLAFARKTIVMLVNLEAEREDYIADRNRLSADYQWAQSINASLEPLAETIDSDDFYERLTEVIIGVRDAHPRVHDDAASSDIADAVIDFIKHETNLDIRKDLA